MTLNQIRECKDVNSLKRAIVYLCDNMQAMTYWEFQAYKRTIESKTIDMGLTLNQLNDLAETYQIYGDN